MPDLSGKGSCKSQWSLCLMVASEILATMRMRHAITWSECMRTSFICRFYKWLGFG